MTGITRPQRAEVTEAERRVLRETNARGPSRASRTSSGVGGGSESTLSKHGRNGTKRGYVTSAYEGTYCA